MQGDVGRALVEFALADWREGVRALYDAMCADLTQEPAMVRWSTSVYAAGPKAPARRDRVADSLAAMLAPGFEENPATPTEAIGSAYTRCYGTRRGPTEARPRGLHAAGHVGHPLPS
jgi:hypothetical protein